MKQQSVRRLFPLIMVLDACLLPDACGFCGLHPPQLMLERSRPDKQGVDELTKEFLVESQESLDRMERCLTELEGSPADAELIGEIFRAVHTIKGTTGFLSFHRLESLSHAGESLLSLVREGRVRATSQVITGLLQLMDGLRNILQLIEATGDEGKRAADDDSELIAHLHTLQLEAALDAPLDVHETSGRMQFPMSVPTSIPAPMAANWLNVVDKKVTTTAVAAVPGPGVGSPLYQSASQLAAAESTLRVDVELLNRMMNLVGELVLTRNQILQGSILPGERRFTQPGRAQNDFAPLARRLDMVTAELREAVMKARMQPVGYVFQKFPRMVRDLARTCGRQIRLEVEGLETELDKSLLEAIKDPVTHAVRNAVDHGIEAPQARLAAGKPVEGVLRLRAFHEGSHVVIEVSDDGAGIAPEKVLAKALERNLIAPEKASSLSAQEVLQLIFLPGFSTASHVSNVSGRGVGMDVVRTNVERIGGRVELESQPGLGTRLRMRIPLTLAIVPALVVRSSGQSFALPQSVLFELVYVPGREVANAVEWVDKAAVYRLRGGLVPLVWLR